MSNARDAYVPPPPASVKKGRSPWFFVGIGCLGLILLTVGIVSFGAYKMITAINRPLTNEEVALSLGNIPIYPKAKLDMTTTKVIQGTAAMTQMMTGKESFAAGVFRSADTPDTVVNWYDAELGIRGYVPTKARQPSVGQKMENQLMHQYFSKKESKIVIVQAGTVAEDKKTDPTNSTMVIVMRISSNGSKGFAPDEPKESKVPAAK
jgi:hypothetical protein